MELNTGEVTIRWQSDSDTGHAGNGPKLPDSYWQALAISVGVVRRVLWKETIKAKRDSCDDLGRSLPGNTKDQKDSPVWHPPRKQGERLRFRGQTEPDHVKVLGFSPLTMGGHWRFPRWGGWKGWWG